MFHSLENKHDDPEALLHGKTELLQSVQFVLLSGTRAEFTLFTNTGCFLFINKYKSHMLPCVK